MQKIQLYVLCEQILVITVTHSRVAVVTDPSDFHEFMYSTYAAHFAPSQFYYLTYVKLKEL